MESSSQKPEQQKPTLKQRLARFTKEVLHFAGIDQLPAAEDPFESGALVRDLNLLTQQIITLEEIAQGAKIYLLDQSEDAQLQTEYTLYEGQIKKWQVAKSDDIAYLLQKSLFTESATAQELAELVELAWRIIGPLGYRRYL